MSSRRTLLRLCLALAATAALPAWGQSYPTRPITLVVPFAPGGSSDILARVFGASLAARLGQSVVIDNKPGGGGIIAAQDVARAAPDGYTLFFCTNGPMAILPALKKSLPFDPVKDFTAINRLTDGLLVLLVPRDFPAQNLGEFISYGRANPGKLSYASAGVGSVSHLASEFFASQAKIDIVHIPYKGGGLAAPDLQSGRVQMMLETVANSVSLLKGGNVRALAVSSSERSAVMPDVPTFTEAGLPKLSLTTWTGLFAPPNLPPEIVRRLSAEVAKIDADPAYISTVAKNGSQVAPPSTPAEFASYVASEGKLWKNIATIAHVEPED